MKTSMDINPEIWRRVRVIAAAQNISLSKAVNDALTEWVAQRKAELEGIGEWVRSEIREENEAEVASRIRDVQRSAYQQERADLAEARRDTVKNRMKKGARS